MASNRSYMKVWLYVRRLEWRGMSYGNKAALIIALIIYVDAAVFVVMLSRLPWLVVVTLLFALLRAFNCSWALHARSGMGRLRKAIARKLADDAPDVA